MFKKIDRFIQTHHLITPNNTIIVGLSGGPDSVFLLHYMIYLSKQYHLRIIAVHLDHEWRTNSYEDMEFCKKITKNLDVAFIHEKLSNLPDILKSGSQEEIGRNARRYFLKNLLIEYHAQNIALAHHLDDQEETFFIRLIRGSTIAGLSAMKPKDGPYIRPLLETYKSDLVEYLHNHSINYIEDPSNQSPSFLRNRIRLQVIPALRVCDDRFDHNFLRTLKNIQQVDTFLETLAHAAFLQLAQKKNHAWQLSISAFFNLDDVIQNRILMYWLIQENVPFTPRIQFLKEIKKFLRQPGSKIHQMHEKWHIKKQKDIASIKKL